MKQLINVLIILLCSLTVKAQCSDVVLTGSDKNQPIIIIQNQDLTGLSSLDYKKKYGIYRVRNNQKSRIPVSCKYEVNDKGELIFEPKYRLANDLDFVVESVSNGDTCLLPFKTEVSVLNEGNHGVVNLTMFPKTDSIPLNILCFHIEFDQPMKPRKDAFHNIKVFDQNKNEIKNIWRNKTYWLKNNTIMVLMIHPARVKRGIDFEIAFKDGEQYEFKLIKGLETFDGRLLPSQSLKNITAIKPDYSIPKFVKSKIIIPKLNSSEPVWFSFDEGMDYASIRDGVIFEKYGKKIDGTIYISDKDSGFKFVPDKSWTTGTYSIVLSKKVCDFAGNRLNAPFEEKVSEKFPNRDRKEIRTFVIK